MNPSESIRYLLDTDTCIYTIKRKPPTVFQHLRACRPGTVAISSVTWAELCYGVENSSHIDQNRDALHAFVAPLEVLPWDASAGEHYGAIRAGLKRSGAMIGSMDLMIAAHARAIDTTLVTNNISEFGRVEGLQLGNWVG